MTSTALPILRALDPSLLTPMVRTATRRPDLTVQEFAVEVLSDKGITNPDGLFLFTGGTPGPAVDSTWSVALKILTRPDQEQAADSVFYWQREALAFHSGLLAGFSADLVIPEHYAVWDRGTQIWIWMEHVQETVAPEWDLPQYAQAAHQLGRFNGRYLTDTPLPTFPWLTTDLARQWTMIFNTELAWEHPAVCRFFSPLRPRITALWEERDRFCRVLNGLPQVFSHFDFQRRNLLIRDDEVIVLDWALCGIGPVGGDLYALVGATCMVREWDAARLRELEQTVFPAYLAGIGETGGIVDPQQVRLAYTAWMAMYGLSALVIAQYTFLEAEQGFIRTGMRESPEELAASWAELCRYCLDLADEARTLMGQAASSGNVNSVSTARHPQPS